MDESALFDRMTRRIPSIIRRPGGPAADLHFVADFDVEHDRMCEVACRASHLPVLTVQQISTGVSRSVLGPSSGFTRLAFIKAYREASSMLERIVAGSGGSGAPPRVAPCDMLPAGSAIHDHLTQLLWGDGTARQTSTIAISAQDGRILLTLRDRDAGRVLYLSGETLSATWDLLTQELEKGGGNWRPDPFAKKTPKR